MSLDGSLTRDLMKTRKWLVETAAAAVAAKSLQLCPTLCDPRDGSPPGSPIPGILQASTLEWVAISFSSAWKWKVKVKTLSHVQLLATPWTAAYQTPLSMGFSRQELLRLPFGFLGFFLFVFVLLCKFFILFFFFVFLKLFILYWNITN